MAFEKKEKAEKENKNVLADPEMRKKFKQMLVVITEHMSIIDTHKESIKETVAETAANYGIEKKHVKKMASTMYKANYGSLLEENRHFETLYEVVIEGKLRDPDSSLVPDPLDAEDDAE